jgi:hypothetical protein
MFGRNRVSGFSDGEAARAQLVAIAQTVCRFLPLKRTGRVGDKGEGRVVEKNSPRQERHRVPVSSYVLAGLGTWLWRRRGEIADLAL